MRPINLLFVDDERHVGSRLELPRTEEAEAELFKRAGRVHDPELVPTFIDVFPWERDGAASSTESALAGSST